MFGNRVPTKVFGRKREEVTGHWRKLHSEELHYLYCSANNIDVIKAWRIRWTELVGCM
jgi:hypothetical protein